MGILGCKYAYVSSNPDLISVFRNCVAQYARNSSCTGDVEVYWAAAQRELLVHAYSWLLYHFNQGEAHKIHRSLIAYSFFWLAFARGCEDRSKPGQIQYNPVTWQDNNKRGLTAMRAMGDPMDKANRLFSTLGTLFDDMRLQRLAVGEPCRPDFKKQEDEIVHHLRKLSRDKQHDAFPLPASVPKPIFVLDPSHRWWSEMPGTPRGVLMVRKTLVPPEELESDESDEETIVPDSTDTEMYQAAERSLLISSDRQALKIQNVARIQQQAKEQARSGIQAQFYEADDQDTRRVHLKRESEEREIDPKCRPSPKCRPRNEQKGCSILKKKTANTSAPMPTPRQPHNIEPRGVGSPLAAHPGVRVPGATRHKMEAQTAFQTALRQCYTDYTN